MSTAIGKRLKLEGFRLDLHGAVIPRVELNRVDLENANLAGADARNASFKGSLFKNADLGGTNLDGDDLRGADLRDARNLTADQLALAVIDETTSSPGTLRRTAAKRQPQPSEA